MLTSKHLSYFFCVLISDGPCLGADIDLNLVDLASKEAKTSLITGALSNLFLAKM